MRSRPSAANLAGGAVDLMGYPEYFMLIIGAWKTLGALASWAPRPASRRLVTAPA